MKLELHKFYKTRSGGKAVVVGYDESDGDCPYLVFHVEKEYVLNHCFDGNYKESCEHSDPDDLIEPWVEPCTKTVWIEFYKHGEGLGTATWYKKPKAIGRGCIALKKVTVIEGEFDD